jgi:hypothetical protein
MASLPINLPWFITLHASGLSFVGLALIFKPSLLGPLSSSPKTKPTPPNTSVLGVASLGLGLAYFATCYMPIAENAFLYASVPGRIFLAAVMIIKASLGAEGEEKKLWGLALYDGLGGIALGLWLGRFDGRVPA